MTKIDIFSGFLGAGKTTLIKKLLKEAYTSEKVVLIENEFGEIGIDGGFLKDAGVEITEMNSGCICCSLVGDFGEALRKVIADFAPDRILIEPSGVGKLSDVVKAVEGVCTDSIVLNGKVTVADASKCKVYMKNFGEFYNNQIENADTIILSRTSAISDEKLATALSLLREKNATATIITTPWEQLDGKTILNSIENTHTLEDELHKLEDEAHHEHHHDHGHHHHHADEVFSNWGRETAKKFTFDTIKNILSELEKSKYGIVLRAKGIVAGEDGKWIHFDFVPEEANVRYGEADVIGRICVIGSKLDNEELSDLFGIK